MLKYILSNIILDNNMTTEQGYSKLEINKLRHSQDIIPEPVGHKKVVLLMKRLPPKFKMNTFNYMSPIEIFTNLLVDNPTVNFSSSFLEYAKYLKTVETDIKKDDNDNIIKLFGLNVMDNWEMIDSNSHLLEIANETGVFWEYIVWDCPFMIGLLASIQNNDNKTLVDYIDFYKCTEPECMLYLYENLIKYAFNFRRLTIIQTIIDTFMPYLVKDNISYKIPDLVASLIKYFTENYRKFSFREIIDDNANLVKTIEILETAFPELYNYFQINWTPYLYHLVKTDNVDKIVNLATNLKQEYQALDYEIVIYSIAKNKEGITTLLLNCFNWNDRRETIDMNRFSDYNKEELEKMVWYFLQNIENSKNCIEDGFDSAFTSVRGNFFKQNEVGINQIYGVHEKRFHMNIYVKAITARQYVVDKWCHKTDEPPNTILQCMFNDVSDRAEFNTNIERQIINKLNRSLMTINQCHRAHMNLPILINEFVSLCQIMYKFEQYDSNISNSYDTNNINDVKDDIDIDKDMDID